jgi:polyhydroxyalkanoate synthesis repressor PhaR
LTLPSRIGLLCPAKTFWFASGFQKVRFMLDSVSYDDKGSIESRIIKRYSNRKLYDTRSSRYVTLPQIAQMVRAGEDVQIIDNRTKEDKTEITLALIISEELKNAPGGIPLTTLRALIRHDSTPPPSGEQIAFGEEGARPVPSGSRLVGGNFFSGLGSSIGPLLDHQEVQVGSSGDGRLGEGRARFEQWQAAMEKRVNGLPDSEAVMELQGQVRRLNERLAEIERRLSQGSE